MIVKSLLVILLCLTVSACVSMRPHEEVELRNLEKYGIKSDEHKVKEPGVAAILNILPGFGNFYLASGTGESSQWAIGAVNLLFWPISVVWGVPEAAIDATVINKKETLYFYKHTDEGRAIILSKESQNTSKQVLSETKVLAPIQVASEPKTIDNTDILISPRD